jgi:hypothetical protein
MALPIHITDGRGTKQKAAVHDDGALGIIAHPEPPFIPQKTELFRQLFTDDGLDTGSGDMSIDGSIDNVEFWVPAHHEHDRYITKISVEVAYAAQGAPYKWADNSALTNGIKMSYNSIRGEKTLHAGIKSNQDLLRVNETGVVTNWEVRHVNANNDYGYFITIFLSNVMPPFGMKLDAGSNQKLKAIIRDDVTAATTLNILAIGFDRFK